MDDVLTFQAAVEGLVDEAVLRRVVDRAGAFLGTVYGKNGKDALKRKLSGYNAAAMHGPWCVLVDLNDEEECAPLLLANWLPAPAPNMCFRIAVREVESWLLADRGAVARFLGVSEKDIPPDTDTLGAPKDAVVNLARRSRISAIREDMVPRRGSGRRIGPAYTSRLIEFATEHWDPGRAAANSTSLRSSIDRLSAMVEGVRGEG